MFLCIRIRIPSGTEAKPQSKIGKRGQPFKAAKQDESDMKVENTSP